MENPTKEKNKMPFDDHLVNFKAKRVISILLLNSLSRNFEVIHNFCPV